MGTAPIRKVIVFESRIEVVPEYLSMSHNFITMDEDDTYGMIYPPQTTNSGFMVGSSLVSASIINKSTRQVSITSRLDLRIYDSLGNYSQFHTSGYIYYKLGSGGWRATDLTMSSQGNGWYFGTTDITNTIALTESEWLAYYVAETTTTVYDPRTVYQNLDNYEWVQTSYQQYKNESGPTTDYEAAAIGAINNKYPPIRAYRNKTAKAFHRTDIDYGNLEWLEVAQSAWDNSSNKFTFYSGPYPNFPYAYHAGDANGFAIDAVVRVMDNDALVIRYYRPNLTPITVYSYYVYTCQKI